MRALTAFAILLAVMTVVIGASYFALRPTEFKVAVPASNTLDQRVIGQAAEMLRAQRAPVRLELVISESTKSALDALEAGTVNLAVVRSDSALQGQIHTVMIMRREAAVLVAPKTGKLQKIQDLPNVMIGIARDGPVDNNLLFPVLDYYGIAHDKVKFTVMPTDEVANAMRQKRIDGIIAVAGIASKQMSDVVAAAASAAKGAIQFIEIEEADAIAKRIPALESIEVEQGTFGGRPPRPAESFNTLGYSVRLVATPLAETDSIADLLRHLYLIRQNLSAAIPGAGLMAAPDIEEATPFLIHPGVRTYVNGDQRSWFDKYNDYIYLGLFLGSGLGSLAAGMFSLLRGGKRDDDPKAQLQHKVQSAFDAVRDAPNAEELDRLEREADEVFRAVFARGARDELSAASIASFDMAIRELHTRIASRRAALAG